MTWRQWCRLLYEVAIFDLRVLWISGLVPILIVSIAGALQWPGNLSQRLAWGGGLLQILGIVQVAWGLHGVRVDLGQPSFRTLSRQWMVKLGGLLGRRRSVTVVVSGVGSVAAAGSASARGLVVDRSSLESRVAALESQVAWLEGDLRSGMTEVHRRLESVSSDLHVTSAKLGAEAADIRKLIDRLFIGGLDLEAAGLAWILCGQVLSTWPDVVASFVPRMS